MEGLEGKSMELMIELDPMEAPMVELNVLRSPGRGGVHPDSLL